MSKFNFKSDLINFLCTCDFKTLIASYPELILYIEHFQKFYKDLILSKHKDKEIIINMQNIINELENSNKEIQTILDRRNKTIEILSQKINSKLSFWERLVGKIDW